MCSAVLLSWDGGDFTATSAAPNLQPTHTVCFLSWRFAAPGA